jgi:hypothetical protein
MEKFRKSTPSDFLTARRKAIMEKAVERRKTIALDRAQKDKTVAPLPAFQKPLAPSAQQ